MKHLAVFLILVTGGLAFAQEDPPASLKPGLLSRTWIQGQGVTELEGQEKILFNEFLIHEDATLRFDGYLFPGLLSLRGKVQLANGDLTLYKKNAAGTVVTTWEQGVQSLEEAAWSPWETFGPAWPAPTSALQTTLELRDWNLNVTTTVGEMTPVKQGLGSVFYKYWNAPNAGKGITEVYSPGPIFIPEFDSDVSFYSNLNRSSDTLESLASVQLAHEDLFVEASQVFLPGANDLDQWDRSLDSRTSLGTEFKWAGNTIKAQGLYRTKKGSTLQAPYFGALLVNRDSPFAFLEADLRYAGEAGVNNGDVGNRFYAGVDDNRIRSRLKTEVRPSPARITMEGWLDMQREDPKANTQQTFVEVSYVLPPLTPVIRETLVAENLGSPSARGKSLQSEVELGYKDAFAAKLVARQTYNVVDKKSVLNFVTASATVDDWTTEFRWTPDSEDLGQGRYFLKTNYAVATDVQVTGIVGALVDKDEATPGFGLNAAASWRTPWKDAGQPTAFVSLGYNMTGFDPDVPYRTVALDNSGLTIARSLALTVGMVVDFY